MARGGFPNMGGANMQQLMRQAQKMQQDMQRAQEELQAREFSATAGGGIALDLPIGQLASGYRFDVIVVDTGAPQGGIRLFDETSPELIFQKIIYGSTRASIASVWVDGRQVA